MSQSEFHEFLQGVGCGDVYKLIQEKIEFTIVDRNDGSKLGNKAHATTLNFCPPGGEFYCELGIKLL